MKFWTVLKKEFIDHLRDRRAVLNNLISLALLGPLLFGVMFKVIEAQQNKAESLRLPVVGGERAPALIAFLNNEGAKVETAPADYEAKLRAGDLDVVLAIPADYAEAFHSGKPAKVELVVDESQNRAGASVGRVERLIEAYSRQTGLLRLVARGVSPDLVRVVKIETRDLALPQQQGSALLKMAVGYGLLAAFIGAMAITIDSTAGERERGSLEPLLINPVTPWQLVAGKWLACSAFSLLAVVVTLTSYLASLKVFPFHTLGIPLRFGLPEMLSALLILAPSCFFFAGLLLVTSLFAKTFKEAQVTASLLIFVVVLPSILLLFKPTNASLPTMLVPLLNQNLLLDSLIRGEAVSPVYLLIAAVVTIAVGFLGAVAGAVLIRRERIVFGQ